VTRYILLALLLVGCDTDKWFPHAIGEVLPPRTEDWVFVSSSSSKHGHATFQPPTGPTVRVYKRRCYHKAPYGTVIPVVVKTVMYSDGSNRIDYGSSYELAMRVCR